MPPINDLLGRIDAVIGEAGRPEPQYAQCVGPGCERSVFAWLDPACGPYCARRAAGLQHPTDRERAEQGTRALVAHAPGLVLGLYSVGQLGYLAASDEWVNGNGHPLIEPLQQAAHDLAVAGELPEFAEWFPAPAVDQSPRVGAVCTHLAEDETRTACCGRCAVCDGTCDCTPPAAAEAREFTAAEIAELHGFGIHTICPPPLRVTQLADAPSPGVLARILNALRKWNP